MVQQYWPDLAAHGLCSLMHCKMNIVDRLIEMSARTVNIMISNECSCSCVSAGHATMDLQVCISLLSSLLSSGQKSILKRKCKLKIHLETLFSINAWQCWYTVWTIYNVTVTISDLIQSIQTNEFVEMSRLILAKVQETQNLREQTTAPGILTFHVMISWH